MPIAVFPQKRQSGFTLIEMLVSMAVSGILLAALASVFSLHATTMSITDAHRAAQTTARGTLAFLARQLTHIGRANRIRFTAGAPAIQDATPDFIRYRTNLSADWGNDNTTEAGEDVSIRYDSAVEAIRFWDHNISGNTSYLTNIGSRRKSYVPANGLVFSYFDANGNAVTATTAAARASIRRITITLTVRGINPQLALGHADEPKVTLSYAE